MIEIHRYTPAMEEPINALIDADTRKISIDIRGDKGSDQGQRKHVVTFAFGKRGGQPNRYGSPKICDAIVKACEEAT